MNDYLEESSNASEDDVSTRATSPSSEVVTKDEMEGDFVAVCLLRRLEQISPSLPKLAVYDLMELVVKLLRKYCTGTVHVPRGESDEVS